MKTWIIAIALFSFAGLAAADELEDSYNQLKDAVAKKDADVVRRLAATASKLAHAAEAAPQPSAADEVETWKKNIDYAKGVSSYTEYALGATASQPGMDATKVVELVEQLTAESPKSKYLDYGCIYAYVTALGNLSSKNLTYASKLVAIQNRARPEGASEADWEKLKGAALGTGYFTLGMSAGQKQQWSDCDKDLGNAVPYLKDPKDQQRLGTAYYTLGVCDYQFGKLINDRSKIMAGQKYSQLAAGIPGPFQGQAAQNAKSMQAELAGAGKR